MKKPFYYALGLHGAIILFVLISSLSFFSEKIYQEQSVDVITANALTSLSTPVPPPVVKPTPPVPKPQKALHRPTIKKEQAVQETVVKNATIAKQEHRSKTKPHKDQKQLHAKQLAHQKQVAHDKELAHERAVVAQNHLKALHAAQVQGIVDRYQAMILQAISQQWMIPPSVDKSLSCTLSIQLAPDGSVLSVSLAQGSGNLLLDRSAVAAVYKASPLPVPQDREAFESFRDITLIVRPEDIIH